MNQTTTDKTTSYSIGILKTLYSNSLSSTFDAQLIVIEGFYQDKLGKLYSGVYYDWLLDKDKKSKITIQLPEYLKSQLTSGRYFQLQGYLNKASTVNDNSQLGIFFRATKVLKYEEDIQLISKVEYDIVRERFDREAPIIRDLLLNIIEKDLMPKIAIITGVKSTAIADYQSQLYDDEYYNIDIHKCNLSSKTEIIDTIESQKLEGYDLLIIIRGGGQGLEVFNDIELSRKFIEQSVPFVTGIGHKEDVTLLQKVSDRAFATPTAIGAFLQQVVEVYKKNQSLLSQKDDEIQSVEQRFKGEKQKMNEQIDELKNTMELKQSKNNKIIVGLILFCFLFMVITVISI